MPASRRTPDEVRENRDRAAAENWKQAEKAARDEARKQASEETARQRRIHQQREEQRRSGW